MLDTIKTRSASFNDINSVILLSRKIPAPGFHQLLVRMKVSGICKYDLKCFKGKLKDPDYSRWPGHEAVGIVEDVGKGVDDIKSGDKVTSISFGGAMAERFIVERNTIAKIPEEVEKYEYWIAEPVACVVSSLRLSRIEPGDDVVVFGCGYMGSLIIQGLPKDYINNLIAIDIDDRRLDLAKKYGATKVINSLHDDVPKAVLNITGRLADIVFEAVGEAGTIEPATNMVRNGGRLVIFGHHVKDETITTGMWHMKGLEVLNTTPFSSKDFHKDLVDAVKLLIKKKYDQTELITHKYPFKEIKRAFQEASKKPQEVIKSVLINE